MDQKSEGPFLPSDTFDSAVYSRQTDLGSSDEAPGAVEVTPGVAATYTDSSLQYADDTGEMEEEERLSNANSASYGSRNQTTTLPLMGNQ